MNNQQLLTEYMTNFRLECHYRLDMVPGDIKELPIFMYTAAQKAVRENMIRDYKLSEEDIKSIDELAEFFLNKLEETDHFTKTDDMTMKAIESGKFNK